MIHWTPIQEHGKSDGTYSIRNQLANDPSMSNKKNDSEKDGGIAREEYGLMSLTNVALNHTSEDCPWLNERPEAGL